MIFFFAFSFVIAFCIIQNSALTLVPHVFTSSLIFQFIPDQGWTSGYSQNGSSGVTDSYGGGGQMHGGEKDVADLFFCWVLASLMNAVFPPPFFFFKLLILVISGGGSWNNNRQSWAGHWGGDKAGLTNSSVFGSHNGVYASSGGGYGGGGGGGGGKKRSFIFQLSA